MKILKMHALGLAAIALAGCAGPGAEPGGNVEPITRVFALEHAEAGALAATLEELMGDIPEEQRSDIPLEIVADGESNSLLLRGAEDEVSQVLAVVERLDR